MVLTVSIAAIVVAFLFVLVSATAVATVVAPHAAITVVDAITASITFATTPLTIVSKSKEMNH